MLSSIAPGLGLSCVCRDASNACVERLWFPPSRYSAVRRDRVKIAIVDWVFPSPMSVFAHAKASSFRRMGHDVSVITTRRPGGPLLEGVAESGLLEETIYIPPGGRYRWPADLASGFALAPHETASVIRNTWRTRALDTRGQSAQALRGVTSMRKLRDCRFDMVHVEWGPLARRFSYLGRYCESPMVVAFKGMGLFPSVSPSVRGVASDQVIARSYQPLIRRADAVTAVSPYLRDRMLKLGFDANKIHVVQEGVDMRVFNWVDRDWSDVRTWRLVSTGRLVDVKGIDVAIRALASIKDKLSFEYSVVGDGPKAAMLAQLCRELGIEDRVRFLGHRDWSTLVEEYARMHVFLFPGRRLSTGQEEAGGATPREAAATGLPVVSSRVGGAADNVVDGVTGRLVSPESVPELAAAILHIASQDADELETMSRAASKHIRDSFSREYWDARLVDLYSSLL